MGKYLTKFRSRKNKRHSKINKSRRIKNKHTRRKHRKKTRKRKQKRTRRIRNLRGGRPPPYTKDELYHTIRGGFMLATINENPSRDKFVKVVRLLMYVNLVKKSMDGFTSPDTLRKYNEKTDLVNMVNILYDSYEADKTYENALDNIIRELAGLAMRGVPHEEKLRRNAEEAAEEGKDITDFENPTDMMIDNYFPLLYPRVKRETYYDDS